MKKILLSLILINLISPIRASADEIIIQNPLQAATLEVIIDNLINFILRIAIVLAPLMIIVGGLLFITSGGNVQQVDRAKKLLLWTTVGLAIILLSKGVLAIINQLLGVE